MLGYWSPTLRTLSTIRASVSGAAAVSSGVLPDDSLLVKSLLLSSPPIGTKVAVTSWLRSNVTLTTSAEIGCCRSVAMETDPSSSTMTSSLHLLKTESANETCLGEDQPEAEEWLLRWKRHSGAVDALDECAEDSRSGSTTLTDRLEKMENARMLSAARLSSPLAENGLSRLQKKTQTSSYSFVKICNKINNE